MVIVAFAFALARAFTNDNDLRLWYTKPASELSRKHTYANSVWQENTLPIGNGFIGANVFGEVRQEHLTLNEKTLWRGGPSKSRPNYMGGNVPNRGKYGKVLRDIQGLFREGNSSEASKMCNQLTGDGNGYGAYSSLGNLYLDFDVENYTDYVRYLDLDKGIVVVEYTSEGTRYKREFFISYPANVLAVRLSKEGEGSMSFDVSFPSLNQPATTRVRDNTLEVFGELTDNQMKFYSKILVEHVGGCVSSNFENISVKNASEVFIYLASQTDYKQQYPHYRTGETMEELRTQVTERVISAAKKGYEGVKAEHLADFEGQMNRVIINISQVPSSKPTNELLANYKKGTGNTAEEDRDLEVMLFQYGRYLTLGSSREKNLLPSNLQGIWNDKNQPPWSSDYHMNINLQMNYFPTYVTDLYECAVPLIEFVDALREPGRVTASIYAGINSTEQYKESGFMAHTQNTPFGWTCPGWSFSWGWSPAAVPWILHNCFEYYEFTKDESMLRDKIYPMLKEEAALYGRLLVQYSKDDIELVSSPTYSPEIGPRTNGNVYEQSLIWQHFNNTITAAKILGVDKFAVTQWEMIMSQLKFPIEIGDDGQIKEWFHETTIKSVGTGGHRHLSHLLGLYPLNLISIDNKEWIDAAKVSLKSRGDSSTGWGMGHRINCWARTGDGEHAHKLIKNLLKNGIYNNLWDTHPPFQIDGNFAATSGIAEMLIQSNLEEITFIPAIPDVWRSGSFQGLVARGNFKFDITWEDKVLTSVSFVARSGGTCRLFIPGLSDGFVKDELGNEVPVTVIGEDRIAIETKVGHRYFIDHDLPK